MSFKRYNPKIQQPKMHINFGKAILKNKSKMADTKLSINVRNFSDLLDQTNFFLSSRLCRFAVFCPLLKGLCHVYTCAGGIKGKYLLSPSPSLSPMAFDIFSSLSVALCFHLRS